MWRVVGVGAYAAALAGQWLACSASPLPPACGEQCQRIAAVVDPLVESEMAATGIPGAALVFVRDGKIVYQRGYGVSDMETRTPVDPERTVWPIASVTKTVTAIAAMQLVDAGKVGLDTDVNRYLERIKIPAQGYPPLTLRHLLSHTTGLDELPGRQFDGKSPPDLAAFLSGRLVRYRAPGRLTAYSTYGIALAGVLIEDVSGLSYPDYLERHIFRPAGMTGARIMIRSGDERGIATPYAVEDGRAAKVAYEWYATPPSSSMVATANDMARLLIAHFGAGKVNGNQLLSPPLVAAMHRQAATNHPALPGWGLGFQLDRVNGVAVAEHGGDIAGFSSLLVLMPEKNSGFFIVNHGEGGNLRFEVKQALLDALYPDRTAANVPAPDAMNAVALREYAGRYVSTLSCRTCREQGDVFEVVTNPNGSLSLWGQTWLPLRRDLFVRNDGKRLLGFTRDQGGRVDSVTGGSWRVADRIH